MSTISQRIVAHLFLGRCGYQHIHYSFIPPLIVIMSHSVLFHSTAVRPSVVDPI